MEQKPVLEMRKITKIFPGVIALKDVSFSVNRSEVHCLVGQNGAGKSTLIKILAGAYRMDEGAVYLEGEPVHFSDPHSALQKGISVLYQELALNPHFNVSENIYMGREPRSFLGLIDYDKMHADAEELLKPFGVNIDIRKKISELSVAQQQIVSLAKALSFQAKAIIFDEPSAVLTTEEITKLFQIIRDLKEKGVSIIYISHRLEEIFDIGDKVTVLRDGKLVGTYSINEVNEPMLVQMMIGRELESEFPSRPNRYEETILELKNFSVTDLAGPCSFRVARGEIVGVFGLVGAGRTELVKGLFGAFPSVGEVYLEGKGIQIKSPLDAINQGIGLVPESRKEEGLILGLSVEKNLTICLWWIYQKAGFLPKDELKTIGNEYVKRLAIKTPGLYREVKNLSGGNQQKVVLAKWLARKCRLLIMDEPTRGIDVGAKREIYQLITDLAAGGLGLIVISSELPEVMNLSHRILVMRKGSLVGEYEAGTVDEETVLAKAMGVTGNEK